MANDLKSNIQNTNLPNGSIVNSMTGDPRQIVHQTKSFKNLTKQLKA